jgi:hypothetical protein
MEVEGTLEGVQHYTIHGGNYIRVFYSHADDPETILQCQLPGEAIDSSLKPSDPITINYLLKTVMSIARLEIGT